MKIGSFFNVIPLTNATRTERSEGEGGNAREQYSQQKKDDQKREQPKQATPEQIDEAIQSFKADADTQASGLSATVEGSGPGLKVHVKDCNGTTLRQFSGDEFLRLREASGRSTGKRGKILDQKL